MAKKIEMHINKSFEYKCLFYSISKGKKIKSKTALPSAIVGVMGRQNTLV